MRDFDLILYGATGFTGRLVAEYLLSRYGHDGDLRWAIAGRDARKLARVASELGMSDIPSLVADAASESDLARLAQATSVVCSTVGPYARYGSTLVGACAGAGTHYCDLTGEVHWMRRMIDQYEPAARTSGARIVHACGFDSIPSDLGTYFLQQAMLSQHGVPARHVKCRVGKVRGGFSGGTVASLINVLEQAARDRELRRLLADPYSLVPVGAPRGEDRNDQTGAIFDPDFGRWTLPFIMAAINTRVVRRSNALLDFAYGREFRYDESMLAPAGMGPWSARISAMGVSAGTASMAIPPIRALAKRFLPAPGEGPNREKRENGFFELYFLGLHPGDGQRSMVIRVAGDRDPGYGATARMVAEAAVCLARDELSCAGGFWTPASAMGSRLIDRLCSSAGMTFEAQVSVRQALARLS